MTNIAIIYISLHILQLSLLYSYCLQRDTLLLIVMEQVVAQCNDALNYPQNFAGQRALEYQLTSYFEQLNEHQTRLFSKDDVALTFRDLDSDARGELVFGRLAAIHAHDDNETYSFLESACEKRQCFTITSEDSIPSQATRPIMQVSVSDPLWAQ